MSRWMPVIKGLGTYIPGVYRTFARPTTRGTDKAHYCYDTWLKHVTIMAQNGLEQVPGVVAELGPGDTLGSGLAALLSGADHYVALDVVRFADVERNVAVFDELVEMFRRRAPRPVPGWPDYGAMLGPDLFPHHILTDERLQRSLAPQRVAAIRHALRNMGTGDGPVSVRYVAPWTDPTIVEPESVDLIFSHSVLEHVNDLPLTYAACARWLKPGGWMSHQVDFRSHGTTPEWNGHWSYSEQMWKLVVGKRPYLLNRMPASRHLELLRANGFEPVCEMLRNRGGGIGRERLAPRWRGMSDADLATSGAFLQARMPA